MNTLLVTEEDAEATGYFMLDMKAFVCVCMYMYKHMHVHLQT